MPTTPAPSQDDLATQFASYQPKLHAIAHRTLGSPWDADDAVQEAWLRLQRADVASIVNLEAWLTTVISRVSIDMIRRQSSRREDAIDSSNAADAEASMHTATSSKVDNPAEAVMHTDDLALAMQIMLDHLGPLERLALVLHDVFGLSYDDIAPIVERTPTTSRQLASRARARLRSVDVSAIREQRETEISTFLDAARNGNFGRLLQLLDPEIQLRADTAAVELAADGAEYGAPLLANNVHGVDAVARVFAGRAELTHLAIINGLPAAVYIADDTICAVYLFSIDSGRIIAMDVLADPAHLVALDTTSSRPRSSGT